jgi:hypothetical protein
MLLMTSGLQTTNQEYKSRFCVCKEYEIQLGQGKAMQSICTRKRLVVYAADMICGQGKASKCNDAWIDGSRVDVRVYTFKYVCHVW